MTSFCLESWRKITHSFLERLNNFDSNFKFTYNHSPEQINFLDVSVYLKNGKIETDIFVKPTDCHQ